MIEYLKSIKNAIMYYFQTLINKKLYEYYLKLQILDDESTINEIIKNKKSISRFGDGEFLWLLNEKDTPSFQENNYELSRRLKEVILAKKDNLLVCIPKNLQKIKNERFYDKWFWRRFVNIYGEKLKPYLKEDMIYGNTNVSRFYMGYRNKKQTSKKIKNLKNIWQNKEIVIVEGKYTKLGVGNDLFNNAKKIERIICPAKNAFDNYKTILEETKKNSKEKLIIISLGPTATILAYDLCKTGYQALDLGHIDIEYEWYLKKAKSKISVNGKFVNEAKEHLKNKYDTKNEANYRNSIITVIK